MAIDAVDEVFDLQQRVARRADEGDAAFDFGCRGRDQRLDLLGSVRRALRQFAHFLGDDRKAAAGVARTGSFDTGVEGEKVRLEGDLIDHGDDLADLVGRVLDPAHGVDGAADNAARLRSTLARLVDHVAGFVGTRGGRTDGGGDLVQRRCGLFQCCGLLLRALGKIVRGRAEFGGAVVDGAGGATHVVHGGAQRHHGAIDVGLQFGERALELAVHALGQVRIGQRRDHATHFRHGAVDAADELVDAVGEAVEVDVLVVLGNAAGEIAGDGGCDDDGDAGLQIAAAGMQDSLLSLQLLHGQRIVAEDVHRAAHFADFVLAVDVDEVLFKIALGKAAHGLRH